MEAADALQIVSYVGWFIGIVCLILAIMIYQKEHIREILKEYAHTDRRADVASRLVKAKHYQDYQELKEKYTEIQVHQGAELKEAAEDETVKLEEETAILEMDTVVLCMKPKEAAEQPKEGFVTWIVCIHSDVLI